jgi:hypothetical protein
MKNEEARQSRQLIQGILQKLQNTREQEFSCEETYHLIDQYAEIIEKGEDAQTIMPLINHHLDMCPDCREEFEALLQILENISPNEV